VAIDHTVEMNGEPRVTFMVARQAKKRKPGHAAHWRVYRRQKVAADMLAVLRLDTANRKIADCVLVPSSAMTKRYLRLSTVADLPPQAVRIGSVADLVQALKTRLRNLKPDDLHSGKSRRRAVAGQAKVRAGVRAVPRKH
jgi:hypothetical protein